MKGISDSQGPEKWVMLLQIPFEPGQKTPREHSFHSKAGFKAMVVQKRLAPFSPVPFLINLSSIKKTDSKKWEKKRSINMFLLHWLKEARAIWKAIPQIWTAGFHLAMEPIIFAFKQMCQTEGMEILHIFLAASRTCWEASYCLVCLMTSFIKY